MAPRSEDEDGIAIPPAPNWYGSALADWGVGCNDIYAYAARNTIVLLRPNGGGKGSAVGDERPAESSSSSPSRPDRDASFAGTLVGHHNRVTALAFARCPGVEHLLLSGSADKTVRLWDVADSRCVKILRGHAVDVTALATSHRVPDLAVSGDRSGKLLVWRFGGVNGADGPAQTLEPLDASPALCLAMSPHPFRDEVACGHQSGALGVYVLSGDGAVRKRLPARSGDAQACAWMPSITSSRDSSEVNPDSKERVDEGDPPMVLAVGSREKAVTLWSWDGARTSLRKTLTLPRCPPHLSEAQRGRLWLSLAWSANDDEDAAVHAEDAAGAEPPAKARTDGRTVHLVTASHGGDLLRWTLDVHELLGSNGAGHVTNAPVAMDKFGPNDKAHARTVFTIRVKRGAAVTTSLDRSVSVWDVGRCERVWSTFGLGGFSYHVGVDPEDPFRASVACGDGSLRSLDLHHARNGGNVLWRGLPQTKATCAAWCPPAEEGEGHGGRVAVGLEDGRVVVVDVGSQGRYAVQRDCHAGPTVAAQWIRCGYSDGDGGGHELWTLGEGRLWRWRFLALPEDRRKGKGAGDQARGGSGGIFEDVTDLLAGTRVGRGFASTFEWLESRDDAGDGDSYSEPLSRLAVGWNDGRVSVHRRRRRETGRSDLLLPGDDQSGWSWTELWSAREHTKRVTAVRWHPRAAEADDEALFPGWLAATSKDGSFLVYDGGGGVVRSPPSCRQALNDVAWAPGGAGAVAATAGQDGLVRVVDVSFRPSLRAVMRGHDGSVLCVCWARVDDAGGTALLSGSDDQTLRRWDPDDPSHYPSAIEEKEKAEKAEGTPTTVADAEPSAASKEGGGEEGKDAPTLQGSNAKEPVDDGKRAKKKAKKASGGRGLLKAPAWESTPEGVAAGQAAAVDLARRLHGRGSASTAGASADDDECTYGPSGVGLYLGQEEATRLLALEERASLAAADGGGYNANVPYNSASSSSAGDSLPGGDSPGASGGAFRPAERAACAALFRGDYVAAAKIMLGSGDGPVPPDFLAACVGGGRDLYASVAREQADRLERRGEHQRAALLHLSLHDVVAALGSLRRGGFIRDAAALAAARLHPGDETLVAVRRELAAAEETRGGMEAAAKAHLAAGRPAAAVRALTRRTLGGARAAAEVALTCGLRGEPERHAVLRAAAECAEMGDVEGARSVISRWREGTTEGEGGESEVEAAEAAIETLVVTRQVSLIDL